MLVTAFIAGFLLGGSLIIAIGAQNAFILRQGLLREHVFILCLVCALSDTLLIAAGVGGLGTIVSRSPWLIGAVTIGGALFLAAYAVIAFRRAFTNVALEAASGKGSDLKTALATCLAFTFLNPHVYLDTVVLIGSLSGGYPSAARLWFGIGAGTASFVWFFGLGYGARLLEPFFAKPSAWRVLDILIGLIMAGLSLSLVWRFLST